MTPTQLAQAECANYDRGGCNGKPCPLGEKRCAYFEECVLPLADSPNLTPPDLRAKYAEAANKYRVAHNLGVRLVTYRKCGCGAGIGARVRYCPTCARNVRKERERERLRRLRAAAVA